MNKMQRQTIQECLNIIQGHRYISIGKKLRDIEERLQTLLETPSHPHPVENVSQEPISPCACEGRI